MAGPRRSSGPRDTGQPAAPGWRPLPPRPPGPIPPFARLARAHALSSAGDALVAIGLAGSLFFSISPEAARGKVALYLALTMAPFALVAPLIGPLIDRRQGSRRAVLVGSIAGRAVVCFLMSRHLHGLLLFPEAFAALVLGKGYAVAKAALVPAVVDDAGELVRANAKLTLISAAMGFAAAGPGVLAYQFGGEWVLGLATVVFVVGTGFGFLIPSARPPVAASAAERAELRSAGVLLAAAAMAVLRGLVGFLAFLLAFSLRADDAPAWWFGVVLAASGFGAVAGAVLAPLVRRRLREERILLGCLVLVALAGLLALQSGGRAPGAVLAFAVGMAASAGRLCFDAVVQRDAPDADKGRSFARFETQFQLAWVLGALVPVALAVPTEVGYGIIAIVAVAAALSYLTGRQPWRLTHR